VLRWATDKVRDGYQIRAVPKDGTSVKELANPLLAGVALGGRQSELGAAV
jgi:hypothetical protein